MRGWVILISTLVVGIAIGAAGAMKLPTRVDAYLPAVLRPSETHLTGPVLGKQRERDRVLLKIAADHQVLVATFTEKIPEVDLLVAVSDTVTLDVPGKLQSFVENPFIQAVTRGTPATQAPAR